jgi:hypothetical protein
MTDRQQNRFLCVHNLWPNKTLIILQIRWFSRLWALIPELINALINADSYDSTFDHFHYQHFGCSVDLYQDFVAFVLVGTWSLLWRWHVVFVSYLRQVLVLTIKLFASLFWLLDFEALLSVVHMACVLEYAEVWDNKTELQFFSWGLLVWGYEFNSVRPFSVSFLFLREIHHWELYMVTGGRIHEAVKVSLCV